jgi:competence protein ComEC
VARLDPGKTWRYGDRLRLEGRLYTPAEDEGFSYREYLQRRGIYSQMQANRSVHLESNRANPLLAGLYMLRARSLEVLYQMYPDPEAALLAGILLGIEQGIPEEVYEAFRVTGTAHIIAISGFVTTSVKKQQVV